MENNYKERMFDSFINKTIIWSSKEYFRISMKIMDREKTVLDNEKYSEKIQGFFDINNMISSMDQVDYSIEIKKALSCLSDIEQAVIFLLYIEELSQEDAAKILEIWSKSVSRIKLRAIEKLKKVLEGDVKNE